jgi:hypothetical protein
MPAPTRRSAIAALGFALLGCASGGAGASRGGDSPPPARRRRDVITREEIAHGQYASAYDVVHTLRPQWLVPRGSDTILAAPGEVQVRVDESWLGGIATLRSVAAVGIEAIRWVDPVSAAGRWGGDFRNGAIVIVGLAR